MDAGEPDFAAQQHGQFAADGQAQAGAAVFARRAGIGLLEGLEDEPLLLRRDADAGVLDGEGDDLLRLAQHRMIEAPARRGEADTHLHMACEVNLTALESRFLRICCRRFGSLTRMRGRSRSNCTWNGRFLFSATCRKLRSMVSRRPAKEISSTSTVTVPDSIFERSRMSLIRFSRSEPDELMLRANSTCLGDEVAAGVFGQLLAQDQDRIERRAQLVRHVGEELGLVLRGERQLGGLFFQGAAGLLDLAVLALDLGVLLGEQPRLGAQLFVGLLQLALARLQLDGQLLRLLEQAFGAHRASIVLSTTPMLCVS